MQNQIEIFQGENNEINVEVKFEDDTVWLSQRQMSELFAKDSDTIGLHIKNIYNEGELERNATTEDYSVVQNEGKRVVNRDIVHYNLDVIISVGYRVNSKRGTQFRQWATQAAKDYYVSSSPTIFLLDSNNKIVLRPPIVASLDSWLENK